MKKRNRKLWQALDHQMTLTLEAISVIKMVYAHDTASDESPSEKILKPDVHAPIVPVEPTEHLRSYR